YRPKRVLPYSLPLFAMIIFTVPTIFPCGNYLFCAPAGSAVGTPHNLFTCGTLIEGATHSGNPVPCPRWDPTSLGGVAGARPHILKNDSRCRRAERSAYRLFCLC